MPAVEHERIDVTPDFAQVRYQPHFAIDRLHRRYRQAFAYFVRARRQRRNLLHLHRRRDTGSIAGSRVSADHRVPRSGVHKLVHQPQAGHGVFGVTDRFAVTRRNLRLRELRGERRPADQQRNFDPSVAQIVSGDDHLLRAFHQQTRKADGVRLMLLISLDQVFGRNLDAQIHNVVAIIFQNNLYEIFADVVNIALYGGQNNAAALRRVRLLHELLKMADRGFHRFRGLQNFRDDQLVGIEQPPDLSHARHQRAVDDIERGNALGALSVEVRHKTIASAFDNVAG